MTFRGDIMATGDEDRMTKWEMRVGILSLSPNPPPSSLNRTLTNNSGVRLLEERVQQFAAGDACAGQ